MPPRFLIVVLVLLLVVGLLGAALVRDRRDAADATAATAAPPVLYAKSARYRKKRPKPTLGQRAAAVALRAVGVPYRWGGESPSSGFDCSGLVRWAYGRLGVDVPHSSYALYDLGRQIPRTRLQPGDVLFFSGLGHVGLYLGRGRMVHAPQSGRTVEVVALHRSYYGERLVGARRVM
jgi:cell wall-associated NlpC family hydrolase